MKKFSKLRTGVAPVALGVALFATPAFAQDAAPQGADEDAKPAEIIVTGSRINNPNLTSVSPVTVVSSAEVKAQGNTRVEDLLNSLPQVFASQGSTDANGASGIATVDLRNLGSARTLVLINGRRLGAGDPTSVVADLNFIPGSLIQRVDVLTGGASATYGSDALAGVVNFVLDTKFEGFRIDAQYSFYNHNNDFTDPFVPAVDNVTGCDGQPAYDCALAGRNYQPPKGMVTDGGTKNITISLGAGFDDGRGHVVAYAGWRKVNAVTQGDRDFSYCGYSAGTTSSSNYYTCGGSSTSANGRFRRTTNVSATSTPVYRFTGPSYSVDPNASNTFRTYSSARDGFNFNPYNYFQRPDERWTAGAFANYEINENFKPYLEVMFMDDHTRAQIAPSGAFYGTDFFINCNNPLMSAAQQSALCGANAGTSTIQSVYIGRRNVEGGGRVDDLRHTDYRIVLGMKGDISGDGAWSYDVYGQFWRAILAERYENDFSRKKINNALNVVIDPSTSQPVCASYLDGTDRNCVPWNIWTPGGVTQAAVNYLQTPGFRSGQTTEYVASAVISGDLGKSGIKSPWADNGAQVAFGAEYRKEQVELTNDIEFLTGDLAGQGTPFGVPDVYGEYTVKELFAELALPLVSGKPGFDSLALTAGYRYSDYSLSGSTHTYKFELEWAPISQVRFRGSYNRAVRAPNTLELFSAPNVGLFSRANGDPCGTNSTPGTPSATAAECALTGVTAGDYGLIDNNPASQYNQRTSGNANLRPEVADTWTLGAVIRPVPNFSLSVDAYKITIKDSIGTLGANLILDQCIDTGESFFCSKINRSAGGSLWTGDAYIDNPTLNLGKLMTRGIDVTANYKLELGNNSALTFDLVGTYLDSYEVEPLSGALSIGTYDCAGLFGQSCGIPLPKWRHKLRATYSLANGLSVTGAWRFFKGTKNDGLDSNPLLTANINPAVAKIGDVSYFDLGLTARVGDNYTFRIGAQNLLDKTPPFLDSNYSNNGSNTYAQVYDSLGRYIYVGVELNF